MSRKECRNLIFQATVIFMVATVMFMVIVISMVSFLAEQKTMKMTVDSSNLLLFSQLYFRPKISGQVARDRIGDSVFNFDFGFDFDLCSDSNLG